MGKTSWSTPMRKITNLDRQSNPNYNDFDLGFSNRINRKTSTKLLPGKVLLETTENSVVVIPKLSQDSLFP